MRETLEDLYYGNITPCDRQIRSDTSLMKAMEQSQEYEEQLTKLLEGEAHSLLLRLINAENEIGNTLALENFILGNRMRCLICRRCGAVLFQWVAEPHRFPPIR